MTDKEALNFPREDGIIARSLINFVITKEISSQKRAVSSDQAGETDSPKNKKGTK